MSLDNKLIKGKGIDFIGYKHEDVREAVKELIEKWRARNNYFNMIETCEEIFGEKLI